MKKSILGIGLAVMAVLSSVAFAGGAKESNDNKPIELVIGHITTEDNTWHKACVFFKDEMEKRSGGRVKVTIYPNSQLGSEIEMIQATLTGGGVDIDITGESMQTYNEILGIIGMPYAITSSEQMDRVLKGDAGKELEKAMLDAGLRVLSTFVRGPRNITSNKPIRTPGDLKGFIIRTPQSPMTVAAFSAMGAKPTPMAFSEVFTSLQQGIIDGQENPYAFIKSGSLDEVQKYLIKTEHLRAWVYLAIGERKFQSMPKDLQDLVVQVGKETQDYEHKLFLEDETKLANELKKNMTFIDVDQEAFAAKAVPGVLKILTPKQREIYQKMVDAK